MLKRKLNRRTFIGAGSALFGLGSIGSAAVKDAMGSDSSAKPLDAGSGDLWELIEKTPFVDTHEHLWPETHRIRSIREETDIPAPDLGMLFCHYTDSDLLVSGMSGEDLKKVTGRELAPRDKWKLIAPFYARCRLTGYQRCLRESLRALYDEDDIHEGNCEAISEKLHGQIQPGFYRRIMKDVANIEYAHVNSLNDLVFRDNEPDPAMFAQDLWTIGLGTGVRMETLEQCAGGKVSTLEEAHAAIEAAFSKYGPKAIAVKDQGAYWRSLKFDPVSEITASPLFARFAEDQESLDADEKQDLTAHLFRYCLTQATKYGLPVKLHTGYHAGMGSMELRRVRDNLSDLCPLFRDYPDTEFVLMHMSYPYQEELIAVCKQYPNVYADMCWAWIINPSAAVRFLKEFIMAAPASKIFTFGGDYLPVELVPGHARVARMGIMQALRELLEERWLSESEIPELVERLMRGNAHEVFDLERALSHWS
jgi:predicted TIM-barrel fold metal-dependent hydrolase